MDGKTEGKQEPPPPPMGGGGRPTKSVSRHSVRHPPEKREAVLAALRGGATFTEAAKEHGVTSWTAGNWARKAGLEIPRRARKTPGAVREKIVEAKRTNPTWGVRKIRDGLKRFLHLGVSRETVRRTLHAQGEPLVRRKRRRHPQGQPKSFERAKPGEMWQTDIFTVRLREGRQAKLIGFLDDHSRFIVGWGVFMTANTGNVVEVLRKTVSDYGAPTELLSDNGPPYATWRGESGFQKELKKHGIRHVRSRPRHPETCGKIERFWGSLWQECLEKVPTESLDDVRRRIDLWVQHYNFQRPHQGLEGLVPADRFFVGDARMRQEVERQVASNAKDLAEGRAPAEPFYLLGQFGQEKLAIHIRHGRIVVDLGGGRKAEIPVTDQGRFLKALTGGSDEAKTQEERVGGGAGGGGGEEEGLGGAAGALGTDGGDGGGAGGTDLGAAVLPAGAEGGGGDGAGAEPGCAGGTGDGAGAVGEGEEAPGSAGNGAGEATTADAPGAQAVGTAGRSDGREAGAQGGARDGARAGGSRKGVGDDRGRPAEDGGSGPGDGAEAARGDFRAVGEPAGE